MSSKVIVCLVGGSLPAGGLTSCYARRTMSQISNQNKRHFIVTSKVPFSPSLLKIFLLPVTPRSVISGSMLQRREQCKSLYSESSLDLKISAQLLEEL